MHCVPRGPGGPAPPPLGAAAAGRRGPSAARASRASTASTSCTWEGLWRRASQAVNSDLSSSLECSSSPHLHRIGLRFRRVRLEMGVKAFLDSASRGSRSLRRFFSSFLFSLAPEVSGSNVTEDDPRFLEPVESVERLPPPVPSSVDSLTLPFWEAAEIAFLGCWVRLDRSLSVSDKTRVLSMAANGVRGVRAGAGGSAERRFLAPLAFRAGNCRFSAGSGGGARDLLMYVTASVLLMEVSRPPCAERWEDAPAGLGLPRSADSLALPAVSASSNRSGLGRPSSRFVDAAEDRSDGAGPLLWSVQAEGNP
mmetsp:Transcript_26825/g.48202  ORF Transcript_26825/g.48202 Transcript_26825/m.48202 type:complete len:310 (-) Transcript_26825:2643-3572(-)